MSLDEKSRISLLTMSGDEARAFFLKDECYCGFDLPEYFSFDTMLEKVSECLSEKRLSDLVESPREYHDLNYRILNNKDGKYAWRPFELIHPVIYVQLVHELTTPANWKVICERFNHFSENSRIKCLSIPVESRSKQKDQAEQILSWWEGVEQHSLELSLKYEYLAQTDITDCYGSIYTHSIAWALHGKKKAKGARDDSTLVGNVIDTLIQDMRHGQTNGIPQGSVLMDFVSEIVLGYADKVIGKQISKQSIQCYQILRYRDDYRIFVDSPNDGEAILKVISSVMIDLGMKLHSGKTHISSSVVQDSVKADKIEWIKRKKGSKDLQKSLLLIHDFSREYPNSGSLIRAVTDFNRRLEETKIPIKHPVAMIAIIVDIAFHNPRVYPYVASILSKLISHIDESKERGDLLQTISNRFERIAHNGLLQVWLQRIAYPNKLDVKYSEPLCDLVDAKDVSIWNNEWIKARSLKAAINPKKVVNRSTLRRAKKIIPAKEVELFESRLHDS